MLQVAGNSNELAFSIVHDLRNPLSAICGSAELLVTANLDPEQTRRVAANIRRAGEQMKNLLTSIVSVAKGRTDDIQSCKLNEILSAACAAACMVSKRTSFLGCSSMPSGSAQRCQPSRRAS